jgi:hypothetical protein
MPRLAAVALATLALLAAGSVALALSSHGATPARASRGKAGPARLAAAWVAAHVSRDAVVACDQVTCGVIRADGFPARNLLAIKPSSPYPSHASVVVVTQTVRHQYGTSLATDWAPVILAGFGSGRAAVLIRVVAANGASAYKASSHADLKLRQQAAAGLLASRYITASASAMQQLLSGQVDARLIIVITALADQNPVDILAFGGVYPGESPGTPLRTVDLAESAPGENLSRPAYVQFIRSVLRAQPASYRPSSAGPARHGGGERVFQIQFGAPSPLGVFSPQQH